MKKELWIPYELVKRLRKTGQKAILQVVAQALDDAVTRVTRHADGMECPHVG